MKKYLLALSLLLVGCQPATTSEESSSSSSSIIETSTTSESRSDVSTSESSHSSSETATPASEVTVFDETILGTSNYPKVSVPLQFSREELITAITEYYKTNYSTAEKEANFSEIDSELIDSIQSFLSSDETLSPLQAEIRQIQFNLDNDSLYVAQVIVPMTREQAKQVLNDNDIQILNQVLARLGNRLVMIAYYDEASQTLLPVHLTNNTNPLFYYGE